MDNRDADVIRILLVDDHALVRSGLRMGIETHPRLRVVAEAGNHVEAVEAAAAKHPDVILLDLDLGGECGIDLIPALLAASSRSRILLLTGVRDAEKHHRAVRLGAVGLVMKDHLMTTFIKAIEKVHAGEVWLDRSMIANVLHELSRGDSTGALDTDGAKASALKPREREIIRLVGSGLKNQEIAERLDISEATVRHHLTSIFNKLGVSDRVELIIYSYRHRLAELPQ